MVSDVQTANAQVGRRVRLGKLCHRSGVLHLVRTLRTWAPDLRILAYHRIRAPADPDHFDFDLELVSASVAGFRQQMQLLKRRFHTLALTQAVATLADGRHLPRNAVVITFDDGYDDNYRHAWPVLVELGLPATFFVCTGTIASGLPHDYDWFVHMLICTKAQELSIPQLDFARPLPHDRAARRRLATWLLDRLKTLDGPAQIDTLLRLQRQWDMPVHAHPDSRPMNWAQLREMHAAGYEIGSHGVRHRMLAKLSPAELAVELDESRDAIGHELGTPAASIAYPVGGFDAVSPRVMQAVRRAGYTAGCTYIAGTNAASGFSNRYALRRLPVERDMDLGWFAAMLTLPKLVSYPSTRRVA